MRRYHTFIFKALLRIGSLQVTSFRHLVRMYLNFKQDLFLKFRKLIWDIPFTNYKFEIYLLLAHYSFFISETKQSHETLNFIEYQVNIK